MHEIQVILLCTIFYNATFFDKQKILRYIISKGGTIMPNKLYSIPDNIDWTVFRTRLRSLMDSYGYNMSELAAKTNLNITSISRYLQQDRIPDLIAIWRIADHFGVTIDWLCGRIPSKFDSLSESQQEILNKYNLASPADKKIVELFLSKYDE